MHRQFPSHAGAFRSPISSSVVFLSRSERLSHHPIVFRQCTDLSAKLRPRGHRLWDDGIFLKALPSPARFTLKPLIFFTEIITVYLISPFGPFDRPAKLRPRGDRERDDGHSLRFLPSPTRFVLQHLMFFIEAFWHVSCYHSDSLNASGTRTYKTPFPRIKAIYPKTTG